MDGKDTAEFRYRLLQSKTFKGKIMLSPFIRHDAKTIYRERWVTSVGYSLPVTQFTDIQCANIQSPFINAIIAKMGFNWHFPRAVIFGPKRYQGKQLIDYALHQYISHLKRFVHYRRQGKEIGNLMWIHMDQHQQVIGCRKHFLVLASTTRMIHPPEYSTCGKSTKLGITIHIDNT